MLSCGRRRFGVAASSALGALKSRLSEARERRLAGEGAMAQDRNRSYYGDSLSAVLDKMNVVVCDTLERCVKQEGTKGDGESSASMLEVVERCPSANAAVSPRKKRVHFELEHRDDGSCSTLSWWSPSEPRNEADTIVTQSLCDLLDRSVDDVTSLESNSILGKSSGSPNSRRDMSLDFSSVSGFWSSFLVEGGKYQQRRQQKQPTRDTVDQPDVTKAESSEHSSHSGGSAMSSLSDASSGSTSTTTTESFGDDSWGSLASCGAVEPDNQISEEASLAAVTVRTKSTDAQASNPADPKNGRPDSRREASSDSLGDPKTHDGEPLEEVMDDINQLSIHASVGQSSKDPLAAVLEFSIGPSQPTSAPGPMEELEKKEQDQDVAHPQYLFCESHDDGYHVEQCQSSHSSGSNQESATAEIIAYASGTKHIPEEQIAEGPPKACDGESSCLVVEPAHGDTTFASTSESENQGTRKSDASESSKSSEELVREVATFLKTAEKLVSEAPEPAAAHENQRPGSHLSAGRAQDASKIGFLGQEGRFRLKSERKVRTPARKRAKVDWADPIAAPLGVIGLIQDYQVSSSGGALLAVRQEAENERVGSAIERPFASIADTAMTAMRTREPSAELDVSNSPKRSNSSDIEVRGERSVRDLIHTFQREGGQVGSWRSTATSMAGSSYRGSSANAVAQGLLRADGLVTTSQASPIVAFGKGRVFRTNGVADRVGRSRAGNWGICREADAPALKDAGSPRAHHTGLSSDLGKGKANKSASPNDFARYPKQVFRTLSTTTAETGTSSSYVVRSASDSDTNWAVFSCFANGDHEEFSNFDPNEISYDFDVAEAWKATGAAHAPASIRRRRIQERWKHLVRCSSSGKKDWV